MLTRLLPVLATVALLSAQRPFVTIAPTAREVTDANTGITRRIATGEFQIAPTEVTQAEYESVTGVNPSIYKGSQRPVENVSWWDAIRYANARSLRENLQPVYDLRTGASDRTRNGYRLPTEDEWDAAAVNADAAQSRLGIANTKDAALLLPLLEKGTFPVATLPANAQGLHDILGNVWEWTDDFFNPVDNGPRQSLSGAERAIRGGSFVSTRSRWNKGYRSSMLPDHKSRYTGFRLCRTIQPPRPAQYDAAWLTPYRQAPAGFETATGNLTALLPANTTAASWSATRHQLRDKWQRLLGRPALSAPPAPQTRLLRTVNELAFHGELRYLRTEPDSEEKIFVLRPHGPATHPRPVLIVPYYDIDTPSGVNLGGRNFTYGAARAFAQHAVERGYIAVAIRWFGESYGERYDEAVANLKLRHPDWTGLGKWVWDAQRLLDYIATLPDADSARIGIMGHSLGAKMALYAAAMDDRIRSVVFSEGGIGFAMSNYDDFWYLGTALRSAPPGTDQHELLALLAPRSFLLIGGDEYDGPQSWHYINAARPVYSLLAHPEAIGYFNHHKGHSPTLESVSHAFRWLERFLQ